MNGNKLIVLILVALVLFFTSAQGVAHYFSEIAIVHTLKAEAKEDARHEESIWLKWQKDQIDKYQKQHPSAKPETPDFHNGEQS
jgi:hypothetical protein